MTDHEIRRIEVEAYLYSAKEPTEEQKERLSQYLEKKYKKPVGLAWQKDDSVREGFRIEVGTAVDKWTLDEIYDWSGEGKGRQLKDKIAEAVRSSGDVMPLVRQALDQFEAEPLAEEVGTVLTVGDGIATIVGLAEAEYGEIVLFECGIKGMILDLQEE